jgi:hypothetical protein
MLAHIHLRDPDRDSDNGGPLPLRRTNRDYRDILMQRAPTKKGKTTENLIAPTNRRLRGVRTRNKTLIRGPMSGQLHQQRPRTSKNECPHAASRRHKLPDFATLSVTAGEMERSPMRKRLTQFRWSRLISLTGALALLATSAFAQMSMPSMSLQGEKKRALTPRNKNARSNSITITKRRPARYPIKRLTIPGLTFGRRRLSPLQKRSRNKLVCAR